MTLTREEAVKIVPPKDVIEELKDTEVKSGMPHPRMKAAFIEILTYPELDMYTNIEARCRAASKVLIAQLEAKLHTGGAKQYPMEFVCIAKTSVGKFVKETTEKKENPDTHEMVDIKVATEIPNAAIYGIFSSPTENVSAEEAPFTAPKLGVLKLWGDACQILDFVQPNKAYRINCAVTPTDTHYKMTKNQADEPVPIDNAGIGPVKDLITQLFDPFEVAEASYHIGAMQLIHGRIKSCRTTINKKNKMQGHMTLTDANAQFGKPADGVRTDINITWWNAPEFATQWGPGSEVYVMADFADKGDQYGLSGSGHFVVPILGLTLRSAFDIPLDEPINSTPASTVTTPGQAPAPSWQNNTNGGTTSVPNPAAVGRW